MSDYTHCPNCNHVPPEWLEEIDFNEDRNAGTSKPIDIVHHVMFVAPSGVGNRSAREGNSTGHVKCQKCGHVWGEAQSAQLKDGKRYDLGSNYGVYDARHDAFFLYDARIPRAKTIYADKEN